MWRSSVRSWSVLAVAVAAVGCKPPAPAELVSGDAAKAVYVAPGQYDEFYAFISGGFSGQVRSMRCPPAGC